MAHAFVLAWRSLDLDRSSDSKRLLAQLLRYYPSELDSARSADFLALLTDPQIEPNLIAAAGWHLVLRNHPVSAAPAHEDTEHFCKAFDADLLVLALLKEAPVAVPEAELTLTKLRRWLLLARQWPRFPALTEALIAQASLNGGAWPFDEEERSQLAKGASAPLRGAYLPPRSAQSKAVRYTDPITRTVAAQYEGWPYPAWTRITLPKPTTLGRAMQKSDPVLAATLPANGRVLIAGCGSGRQAAGVALRFPDATITAIDISQSSLAYAEQKSREYGIRNVVFRQMDLAAVSELGQRFHAIYCGGVLHHLSDPERGWEALVDVLEPNGIMALMVYSRIAKLRLEAARALVLADLSNQSVTDDLIRQARGRILERLDHPVIAHVARSRDFSTIIGAHDLLLHRHEDPFDLKRIERALVVFDLRLLDFDIRPESLAAAYDAMFPHDRAHRDLGSIGRFELRHQLIGNYEFTCCRRTAGQNA